MYNIRMTVVSAQYELDDGYPYLRLNLDGKDVWISSEQLKPSLIDNGYAFLGDDFEELLDLAPIDLPAGALGNDNRAITLRGFTTDPVVVKLAQDFLAVKDFQPGPVPIPSM